MGFQHSVRACQDPCHLSGGFALGLAPAQPRPAGTPPIKHRQPAPETPPRLARFERAGDQPARLEIPYTPYSEEALRALCRHAVLDLGRNPALGRGA